MIEGIALIEKHKDGKQTTLGLYDFTALPVSGNSVVLSNKIGGLAAYEVLAVEHSPVPTNSANIKEGKLPRCIVYLELMDPMFDIMLEYLDRN
ncbi:hypothetical protein KUV57_10480 [Epibacterium sp. DP7N7-1]|nr:hypothetical protein [Epibacterium sp. DP7N7-1]